MAERCRVGDHGTAFEGTEGWVHVNRSRVSAHPAGLLRSTIGADEVHLPRSTDHVGNFLDCVQSRGEPLCPMDAAMAGDILCHLSAIVIQLKRRLRWDADAERFVDDADANRLLGARAVRSPWHM